MALCWAFVATTYLLFGGGISGISETCKARKLKQINLKFSEAASFDKEDENEENLVDIEEYNKNVKSSPVQWKRASNNFSIFWIIIN